MVPVSKDLSDVALLRRSKGEASEVHPDLGNG